jgi:hypothetical protein
MGKLIGKRPMTVAERMRRYRKQLKARRRAELRAEQKRAHAKQENTRVRTL